MTNTLYTQHLTTLLQRYHSALNQFELDAIIVAAGAPSYYFDDDNSHPFKPYANAQQWLPFDLPANSFIVIKRDKPELIWPVSEDFWHLNPAIPEGEWQQHWQITPTRDDSWCQALPTRQAIIGPVSVAGLSHHEALATWLNFDRAIKTPYEITCIKQASVKAAKGHNAAKQAFLAGASELEIHLAYLQATQQDATHTPYPNIVALNEHAAVLHYEQKQTERPIRPLTLLVDAGATHNGYASDITRTTATLNDDFYALVEDMEELQHTIAQRAVAGTDFIELHQQTLHGIAHLLLRHRICSLSMEEQLEKRVPHHFFPHGLGHLLGLQVHDVAGKQTTALGTTHPAPEEHPFLRMTRTLDEHMVLTIEPGLYFIPTLMDRMKAKVRGHGCDVRKINEFMPYGGIRVEDNIVVGVEGVRNLTEEAFREIQ
ncbi:Xaa-Pro dipeptidase [Marinomonas ostreistagni]|uniref:Xaa-Pro dipeptidase n=1 Tax=Marinomonas ostreistagni TaxID=359209 RepID=UPI0019525AAF|nr:Xaa-Pro dipeptidase [Marinomonas ostreistagni]MBM6551542.1 Xaa-Pro dipeptidase [Marinomonas ostreistagni]